MTDTAPILKKEYVVERQGRQFVLVAGLLDLAHQEGLDVIETTMVQAANDENGLRYIFKATVHTKRGTFTGYGDADPSNVSRAMLSVTCRFAETRSIARALRWAVNVGTVALEEMGDLDDAHEPVKREFTPVASPAANGPPASASRTATGSHGDPATPAQVRAMYAINRNEHGLSEHDVDEALFKLFGVPPSEMTKAQASDYITSLNAQRANAR